MDLFSDLEQSQPKVFKKHVLEGGEIWVMPNFLSETESNRYLKIFLTNINWKIEQIKFYGKVYPVPRKTAWYGYEGLNYTYSGILCNPEPWTPELFELKKRIEEYLPKTDFNSVLLNQYRDGNDKVSWHADDEKELGQNPTIASLSLGATRRFDLKHKDNADLTFKIDLNPGCLVIMTGALQHNWLHQIPVQKKITDTRINLTFRTIKNSDGNL